MFKIILVLLFVITSLCFVTRRFQNPWKLYMCFGKKGSGKTTFLVKRALYYLNHGYTVYTNIDGIRIDGLRYIDPLLLGEFTPEENSVLLLDEVGMLWDNRQFKTFRTTNRDWFKLQRHYHCIVYLASQSTDIDLKLRQLVDGMYLFVSVFNVVSIGKRITRKVVLTEATAEAESRIADNLRFAPIWNWTFCLMPRYQKYFDSFSAPALPPIPYESITVSRPDDCGLSHTVLFDPLAECLSLVADARVACTIAHLEYRVPPHEDTVQSDWFFT